MELFIKLIDWHKLYIVSIESIIIMKSISVSDYLHKWIMDHKDSGHKSADEVIVGLIDKNKDLEDDNAHLRRKLLNQ